MIKLPLDLGDGLIMRRSVPEDADALADFNKIIHREPGVEEPDEPIAAWTRDLLLRPHPTFRPDDFTVVAHAATGRIVSSCNLISQTWTYSGIPFGVGRIELVGTAPEYRNRGLVRRQFEVLHEWSAERGEAVQAITGIPYYYRQFGYEMTLVLGGGHRGYAPGVPKLKEGAAEPYRLRPATGEDLWLFAAVDGQAAHRSLIQCRRDEAMYRYELNGKSEGNGNRLEWRVIERLTDEQPGTNDANASITDSLAAAKQQAASGQHQPVGLIGYSPVLWGAVMGVIYFECLPGVSWLMLAPGVLRQVWAEGEAVASKAGKKLDAVQYNLGYEHPFYSVNHERLPHVRRVYAWYLRVPDIAGFVRRIAPVLEDRLANSIAAGHSGELKLGFFRDGLRILLENGHIRAVESYLPEGEDWHVSLPGLTFLHLLFGYRSLDELRAAYPDCLFNNDDGKPLVDILFPKQHSDFWPVS